MPVQPTSHLTLATEYRDHTVPVKLAGGVQGGAEHTPIRLQFGHVTGYKRKQYLATGVMVLNPLSRVY